MNIAVKYCGGCNCQFERSTITEKLEREFPDLKFIYFPEQGTYDFALSICGCSRKCAKHKVIEGKYGKVVLTDENDYYKIQELIKTRLPGKEKVN